jgi:hypothetical protein
VVTQLEVQSLANELGVDFDEVSFDEFARGVAVELEHTTDPLVAAKIALDHLRELSDYYTRLAIAESSEGRLATIGKSQWVRALDVLVIGPLMIWGAFALGKCRRPFVGAALGTIGLFTIGYNALNYARVREVLEATRLARPALSGHASGLGRGVPGQGSSGDRASGRRSSFQGSHRV